MLVKHCCKWGSCKENDFLYVYQKIDNAFLHTDEKWSKLYIQPDFPVQIKEIIAGPKCIETYKFMPYLQEQIARMCEREMIDVPTITMSSIQYQ